MSTLIIGRDEDLCCQLVRERLLHSGEDVLYLPEDHLFPGLKLAWHYDGHESRGSVGFDGRALAVSDIDGVLARCYGIATSAEDFQTRNGQYLCSEWHALLRGFLQALSCPVINRLRPEWWYKPRLQMTDMLAYVTGMPFNVPRAMVTTGIDEARRFFRLCGNRIRYSPLTQPSNYCFQDEASLNRLEALAALMPLYLSEYIDGIQVDAYVVGREVVFDPPGDHAAVKEQCVAISDQLGLTFCALQFVRTARDAWYCLGLDSMPLLYDCDPAVRARVVTHLTETLVSVGRCA